MARTKRVWDAYDAPYFDQVLEGPVNPWDNPTGTYRQRYVWADGEEAKD